MLEEPMKAILFDLDDTLFDHTRSSHHALADTRRRHEALQRVSETALFRLSSDILEEVHGRLLRGELTLQQARTLRFQRLFEAVDARLDADEALAIAVEYRRAYERSWQPVDGACALLAELARTAAIGIVTNNLVAEQRDKLRVCGLADEVQVLVASEEAGITKPDPAIFWLALERLGCSPGEAVMVGDSWPIDVLGARQAGIRAVWFNRLGRACPDPALAQELRSFTPVGAVARLLLDA
jgi:putative hydrolase of the HAD superfamily